MATTPPSRNAGPYRVEQLDADSGPAWRLSGPGLQDAKAYPYGEFRDKLAELAQVMNFAWHQCLLETARSGGGTRDGGGGPPPAADDRTLRAAGTDAKPHVIDPTARSCSPHAPCDPDVAQAPASTDGAA